ncbi:MAG: DUF167 domain-containing protein [Candidatus Doudnabacteria bacterium]|nr:DUF167 domain-containing protein [Candidatus Doudnabacteria bacterium]
MIIKVHVRTNAHQDKIEEIAVDEYKVWTTAIPTEGEANEAIIEILAEYFNTPPSRIKIKSGNKSTHKLIEIE